MKAQPRKPLLHARPSSKRAFCFFLFASLGFLPLAAQPALEPRPEPGSVIVAPRIEEEASPPSSALPAHPSTPLEGAEAELAWVRIWAKLQPSDEQVYSFALEASNPSPSALDQSSFVWLYRGLSGWDARDYIQVPPGNYRLVVFADVPPPHSDDPETLQREFAQWLARPGEERLLFRSPQELQLRKKERAFFLLTQENSRWQLREMPPLPPSGKFLRMLNLQPQSVGVELTRLDGSLISQLAQNLGAEPQISPIPDSAKLLLVTVRFLNHNGAPMRRTHEMDFSAERSATLAVFTDRYGRISSRLFAD
ncbi:MAG: hypothetical protein N2035_04235 [Chthoniobacterales bacterium]|nr:hypothetical protein [Chthoniobacterales bacterium]